MKYENCKEHMWPRTQWGGSARSSGTVQYAQCNNCLSYKFVFSTMIKQNEEWIELFDEKVVEPQFNG